MSLTARQCRALETIERHLRAREPRLASMYAMFTKLTKDELLPAAETIRIGRWHWLTELIGRWRGIQRRRRLRMANSPATRFASVAFVPFITIGLLVTVIMVVGHGAPATRCGQISGFRSPGVADIATSRCGTWLSQSHHAHPQ